MTRLIPTLPLAALLMGALAVPTGASAHGGPVAERWEARGDRIDAHLDRKGDRVDRRLDRRADVAAANGHPVRADRLDARGDRVDTHLDRKGDRLERRADRVGHRRDARRG